MGVAPTPACGFVFTVVDGKDDGDVVFVGGAGDIAVCLFVVRGGLFKKGRGILDDDAHVQEQLGDDDDAYVR